jgi:hypothetical protein
MEPDLPRVIGHLKNEHRHRKSSVSCIFQGQIKMEINSPPGGKVAPGVSFGLGLCRRISAAKRVADGLWTATLRSRDATGIGGLM